MAALKYKISREGYIPFLKFRYFMFSHITSTLCLVHVPNAQIEADHHDVLALVLAHFPLGLDLRNRFSKLAE